MANSADLDQLASSEANWSGFTLFAKQAYPGVAGQWLKRTGYSLRVNKSIKIALLSFRKEVYSKRKWIRSRWTKFIPLMENIFNKELSGLKNDQTVVSLCFLYKRRRKKLNMVFEKKDDYVLKSAKADWSSEAKRKFKSLTRCFCKLQSLVLFVFANEFIFCTFICDYSSCREMPFFAGAVKRHTMQFEIALILVNLMVLWDHCVHMLSMYRVQFRKIGYTFSESYYNKIALSTFWKGNLNWWAE